jgi:hypothetical protein
MTKLRKFSAKNCPGLTGTIDLSSCSDIKEVYSTSLDKTTNILR